MWRNKSNSPGVSQAGYRPGHGNATRNYKNTQRSPSPPVGALLSTVRIKDLELESEKIDQRNDTKITNCNFVASFNWSEGVQSTIIVPGM
jgi:hypothetical protein